MKLTKPSILVLTLLVSTFAYADHTAPVYDVDSMSSDSQAAAGLSQQDSDSKPLVSLAPSSSSGDAPASVDQRLARVEQQLDNSKQNESSNRINGMQGEIQALRGQVEELTHQLQELRNQQKNLHAEADKVSGKELAAEQTMSPLPRESDEDSLSPQKPAHAKPSAKAGAAGPSVAANKLDKQTAKGQTAKPVSPEIVAKKVAEKAPVLEQPNIAEEQAVYQTAYNLIKVKKYNEAISGLQKMLVKYPSGQFAANAHYWLGELYSLTGDNEHAALEFGAVVQHYPSNPRVADAELKLGLINATLLKWPAAKASFKKVVTKYPGTTSARLAMEQLKLLKQSGH